GNPDLAQPLPAQWAIATSHSVCRFVSGQQQTADGTPYQWTPLQHCLLFAGSGRERPGGNLPHYAGAWIVWHSTVWVNIVIAKRAANFPDRWPYLLLAPVNSAQAVSRYANGA